MFEIKTSTVNNEIYYELCWCISFTGINSEMFEDACRV